MLRKTPRAARGREAPPGAADGGAARGSGKRDARREGGDEPAAASRAKPASVAKPPRGTPPRAAPPAPPPPRKKKKRSGTAAMSEPTQQPARRVRELLEQVVEALGLDGDGRDRRRRRGVTRDASTARTSGCSSAATARRSTPSSTSPSASVATRARRGRAGRRRRRGLPRAAREACAARPTRRPTTADARAGPVALDAMTASERRLVHEYLRERGDVETHCEGDEPDRHLVVASPLRRRDRFTFFHGETLRAERRRGSSVERIL